MNRETLKKYVTIAVLSAFAFMAVAFGRIPGVLFLSYEPKDVIITIGGFLFGPFASVLISVIVSFLEMVTISSTGIIGFFMNVLATCSFATTASLIYKKKRTIKGAAMGLLTGVITATAIMLLWNFIVTPIFMHIPREDVVKLLVPAILPFNLLKGGINTALTMLLYKPISSALRKAQLLPAQTSPIKKRQSIGAAFVSLIILLTCIIFILALKGII
ncbi:MAG TPA: ECF transporter S component [Oscillospiraceae bacterium]|nr:ECF transporter S component [Oscillospiraceae bacterium]